MTAPRGISVSIRRVDAAVAHRFLAFEKQPEKGVRGTNRRFSPILVNRYAWDILSGHWRFTHEGMAFIGHMDDGTADFKDGGQRCRALIQAATKGAYRGGQHLPPDPDVAIDVLVTEGLDENSWRTMNTGKPKLAADFLVMDGEVNTNVLSSLIHLCHAFEREPEGVPFLKDRWTGVVLSPIERQEYLDANPELREAALRGAPLGKHLTVASAAAGFHLALKAGIKRERIDEFMEAVCTGANMDADNPAFRLREMMGNARRSKRKYTREEQLAFFIKAFNKWDAGEKVGNFVFKTAKSTVLRRGRQVEVLAEVFPRFQV